MTRLLTLVAIVVLTMALAASPVLAQMPSPGGGNPFGEHVAGMAPGHPQLHGQMFGECVSTMARTDSCPHH